MAARSRVSQGEENSSYRLFVSHAAHGSLFTGLQGGHESLVEVFQGISGTMTWGNSECICARCGQYALWAVRVWHESGTRFPAPKLTLDDITAYFFMYSVSG